MRTLAQRLWKAAIQLSGVALAAAVGGYAFGGKDGPPACETDISPASAKTLFAQYGSKLGLDAATVESFTVEGIARDKAETWPTYDVVLVSEFGGVHRRYEAIGNGCGLSEVFDVSDQRITGPA